MSMDSKIILPFILIIALFLGGCTTVQNTNPGTMITAGQSPVPSTAVTTPVPSAVSTTVTAPTISQPPQLTSDDVNNHFMDLAFGGGNIYLERITTSPNPITFSISGGLDSDKVTIEEFFKEFNELSQSVKLFENLKEGTSGQIQMKFLSPEGLEAIDMKSSNPWLNKEFKKDGVTYAKVKDNQIYINSGLQGDTRKHYILLALLFELGFKGETLKYPDSIFYYQGNDVINLSLVDVKAAQIMYGLGLYNGMTVDDVKKRIFLKST
jgi:hypothetical protein